MRILCRRLFRQEGGPRHDKFISRLKKMQSALGDLNDVMVHEELTQRAIASVNVGRKRWVRRAKKAFAAGRLSGREEARFVRP
jgi:CHAD domain-containing protein